MLLVRHAALVQHIHRRDGGVAGGQHGIAEDEQAALRLRQLDEILDRPFGLVPVHADMAHARRGDQLLEAIGHPQAGAQIDTIATFLPAMVGASMAVKGVSIRSWVTGRLRVIS